MSPHSKIEFCEVRRMRRPSISHSGQCNVHRMHRKPGAYQWVCKNLPFHRQYSMNDNNPLIQWLLGPSPDLGLPNQCLSIISMYCHRSPLPNAQQILRINCYHLFPSYPRSSLKRCVKNTLDSGLHPSIHPSYGSSAILRTMVSPINAFQSSPIPRHWLSFETIYFYGMRRQPHAHPPIWRTR